MQRTSPIPHHVVLTIGALIFGSYAASFGTGFEFFSHRVLMLFLGCWYPCCATHGMLVIIGRSASGWPRGIVAILTGVSVICTVLALLSSAPWWLLVVMVAATVPPAGFAITGRYMLPVPRW